MKLCPHTYFKDFIFEADVSESRICFGPLFYGFEYINNARGNKKNKLKLFGDRLCFR